MCCLLELHSCEIIGPYSTILNYYHYSGAEKFFPTFFGTGSAGFDCERLTGVASATIPSFFPIVPSPVSNSLRLSY